MIILVIIGVVLIAFAIGIVAHVLGPKSEQQAKTLGQIGTYGFSRRSSEGEQSSGRMKERFDNLAGWLGSAVGGRGGGDSTNLDAIRAQLVAAGIYNTSPGKFLGYRVLCTIGLPLLWIWFGVTVHVSPVLLVIVALLAVAGGWFLPLQFVKDQANRRLDEIDYQLPELIDLLVVTVEAGMGFVGSLQMAATRMSGALGDELQLTLQEQRMGLSIQEALMNMLARVDTPSMRSFVRSVVQGETLGVSIGQIMRDLANEMRRRRRQNAQEKAQKAPIKILFPLVLLIFPAMFVVLLGPALFLFFRAFGGGG
jgi:tight adherence protein C